MKYIIKATIIKLIVAFLFVLIVYGIYKSSLEKEFKTVAGLIDMFAVNQEVKTISPILDNNILIHRPIYGSNYATLKID